MTEVPVQPPKDGTIASFTKRVIVPPVIDELDKKWEELKPELFAQWQELEPKVLDLIKSELATWLPIIIKSVVVGMATTAGHLAADTENKITDMIPGHLDDEILDPIVSQAMDKLGPLIGGLLGGH